MKILHRDLKSANVFLTRDGIVKLGDLNVSKKVKLCVKPKQEHFIMLALKFGNINLIIKNQIFVQ